MAYVVGTDAAGGGTAKTKKKTTPVTPQTYNAARQEQRAEKNYRNTNAAKPDVPAQSYGTARTEQRAEQIYRNQPPEGAQTPEEIYEELMGKASAVDKMTNQELSEYAAQVRAEQQRTQGDAEKMEGYEFLVSNVALEEVLREIEEDYWELTGEPSRDEVEYMAQVLEEELDALTELTKELTGGENDLSTQAAIDEKLAIRKYQEQKEREELAYDLSTQAMIDEKLAIREYLANHPTTEYTEEEEQGNFWDWLFDNPNHYSPQQEVWDAMAQKPVAYNQQRAEEHRRSNERIEAAARQSREDNPEAENAFDSTGHINGQAHESIGNMQFGNSDVATSGCGAIAVY